MTPPFSGEVIYLSSTRPIRTGYIFNGWAKSPSGAVEYQPGSAYGLDANTTLYAIWSPETYTISFDANGGSGAPGNQTKTYDQSRSRSMFLSFFFLITSLISFNRLGQS